MGKINIPYGKQTISEQDIQAVVDVLRSDWLTQGPSVERFERAVADYCGVNCAVAVNSATSALHIACLAAGLGGGDILWTSPISFVASANCARYCGADVDFVDIDPDTCTMSVEELEKKLVEAEKTGRLPKVVVPVHFAGQSCDMERIAALGEHYGFTVIEDAAHAIGGRYRGQLIGNCRYSAMTVFSFHPVKLITTGEGGMVVSRSEELCSRLVRLRSHGITRDPAEFTFQSHGPWYYEQIELGFNYRMTDIQAALGCSQLLRLDANVARRHELVARYRQAFADLPIRFLSQDSDCYSAYHLFVVMLDCDLIATQREELAAKLRADGIASNVHYIPIHLQPYYRQYGFRPGDFPKAEEYYRHALTLPLYPAMTDAQQQHVIDVFRRVIG